MRRGSKAEERVESAYKLGYRVTAEGLVVSHRGRVRKLYLRRQGYYSFNVAAPSRGSVDVHRLVGYQKFGQTIFSPGVVVRHLDGDRLNNKASNISLGTHSQNSLDRPSASRRAHAVRAASTRRKLTKEQVEEIRDARQSGSSYKDLCERYGVAKSTLSYIINRKTYAS